MASAFRGIDARATFFFHSFRETSNSRDKEREKAIIVAQGFESPDDAQAAECETRFST